MHNPIATQLKTAYTHYESGRIREAKAAALALLRAAPTDFDGLKLMGFIAGGELDYASAARYLAEAVRVRPDFAEGWYYLGVSYVKLDRQREAVDCFDAAIRQYPQFFEAQHDKGLALAGLNLFEAARRAFDTACLIRPTSVEAWTNLGIACGKSGAIAAEIACYRKVLQLDAGNIVARGSLATAFLQNKQFDEAIAAYRENFQQGLEADYARGNLILSQLHSGNWAQLQADVDALQADIAAGKECIEPFVLCGVSHSPDDQLQVARRYADKHYPLAHHNLSQDFRWEDGPAPIRVAYLSADFHAHATITLMLDIFRAHDRRKFHLVGISFGPEDTSATRMEIVAAFDTFIDVRGLNDADAAALIRAQNVAIAVDLKGYTADARAGILTHRPAPIQVNYLGYPGTMAAPYIDYLIADRFTVPDHDACFYTEQVMRMPHTYQANGRNRKATISDRSRSDFGLPPTGFVFCSFNNPYKNNARMFAVWMGLLKDAPGSVLWLLGNPLMEENMQREAASQGVDPQRLVFAPQASQEDYLERLGHADLFLDSLPYGAHTTASDALWMNVPVVTCVGPAFPGRVGQSVLNAIGLPELVTFSLEEYRTVALSYALAPEKMAALRQKLQKNIETMPLFDSALFTRNLEALYEKMAANHRSRSG
jgi:protein O-GlcNAc transferase